MQHCNAPEMSRVTDAKSRPMRGHCVSQGRPMPTPRKCACSQELCTICPLTCSPLEQGSSERTLGKASCSPRSHSYAWGQQGHGQPVLHGNGTGQDPGRGRLESIRQTTRSAAVGASHPRLHPHTGLLSESQVLSWRVPLGAHVGPQLGLAAPAARTCSPAAETWSCRWLRTTQADANVPAPHGLKSRALHMEQSLRGLNMDTLCATVLLLTVPRCECSGHGCPQGRGLLLLPEAASPFSCFLHRGSVPGHPEGVWSWAHETRPDPDADLLLLRLLTEH